jgi:hypothetical protein
VGDSEASCESAGELLGIAVLGEATQIVVPNGVCIPVLLSPLRGLLIIHHVHPRLAPLRGWCLAGLFSILKHNPAPLVMNGRGGELCEA